MTDEYKEVFKEFIKKKPEEKKEATIKTISKDKTGVEVEGSISKEELIKKEPEKVVLNFTKPRNEQEKKEKIAFNNKDPEEKKEEPKKVELPFVPVVKREEEIFDTSDAELPLFINWLIYSRKGEGKTSLAFSFPGTHNCITFDNKSQAIAAQLIDPSRVKVKDGVKYINEETPDERLRSSYIDWRYLNKLIEELEVRDWAVIDGGEIFHGIAEMTMRYKNNLMPYEGVRNLNLWKERNQYISQLFHKCRKKASKGIIWTAYVLVDEITEGDFEVKKEVPKWIDAVLYETDCVIRTEARKDKSGNVEFYATVESCKVPEIIQRKILGGILIKGKRINITGKGIEALLIK